MGGPAELVMMGYVAQRYYRDGLNRIQIADEVGVSRFKVARLLQAARERGLVRITINMPDSIDLDLSIQLREKFGLQRAVVVRTPERDPEAGRASLAESAAQLLTEVVEEGDVLGLTAGRTLTAMAHRVGSMIPCEVVQLSGVAGSHPDNGVEVVRAIGGASGGRQHPIYAPLFVASPHTASALRQEPAIASTLRRFDTVTKAFVAVGSWDPPESQVFDKAAAQGILGELQQQGVQADVCATLLAADGRVLPGVADRAISISERQLRVIPEVIAVAGGARKAAAIKAALTSGIVDSLITDAAAARSLLR
ncbi:MAG: sugar-binding transcriptional regulator [Arachnia sp.]